MSSAQRVEHRGIRLLRLVPGIPRQGVAGRRRVMPGVGRGAIPVGEAPSGERRAVRFPDTHGKFAGELVGLDLRLRGAGTYEHVHLREAHLQAELRQRLDVPCQLRRVGPVTLVVLVVLEADAVDGYALCLEALDE